MASGIYLTCALDQSVGVQEVLKELEPEFRQGAYILDYLYFGYGGLTTNQKKMVR